MEQEFKLMHIVNPGAPKEKSGSHFPAQIFSNPFSQSSEIWGSFLIKVKPILLLLNSCKSRIHLLRMKL
jgi:hypothetical protein